jgi:hypothetical protein
MKEARRRGLIRHMHGDPPDSSDAGAGNEPGTPGTSRTANAGARHYRRRLAAPRSHVEFTGVAARDPPPSRGPPEEHGPQPDRQPVCVGGRHLLLLRKSGFILPEWRYLADRVEDQVRQMMHLPDAWRRRLNFERGRVQRVRDDRRGLAD